MAGEKIPTDTIDEHTEKYQGLPLEIQLFYRLVEIMDLNDLSQFKDVTRQVLAGEEDSVSEYVLKALVIRAAGSESIDRVKTLSFLIHECGAKVENIAIMAATEKGYSDALDIMSAA